ncbi:MAG: PIG-L deacetylase family protein, partial [Acidimicrobiales bacterium]
RLCWGGFTDGAVPSSTEAVNAVETAIRVSGADLVYTHCARDTHQDHRATSLASLAATRHVSRVLCYESPTTIGFSPSLYVNVAGLVEAKLDLVRCHISQVLKNGIVDLEAIEAQARFRGFNSRARFAEGFEVVRFLLDPMRAGPNGASAGTTETTETTGSIEESGWAVSRNASNMDLELEA